MAKLKPILLVSYFFPPIGMAGSARAYGLFRYLPEFGYQPYVVTVRDIAYPAYDNTLLTTVDEQYICRTESLDPSRLLWRMGYRKTPAPTHSKFLPGWITPDYKRLWTGFAIRAARKIIAREHIKVIMTTSPTPSAHIVGQELRRLCDVTWLADYRDMWVTRPIEGAYSSEPQKDKCKKLLNGFRAKAEHVTAVNKSIARYTNADTVITNAVDPAIGKLWDSRKKANSHFSIGYLGTTDSAETIDIFVSALARALTVNRLSSDSVKTRFVGAVDEMMLRERFESVGLLDSLECYGYLPRHKAIEALADVDALLVTIPEEFSYVTPSKIFDCLVSGKPLIVIAPHNSELANLANDSGEKVFSRGDGVALQDFLAQLLKDKRQHGANCEWTRDLQIIESRRERHSWRTMAKSFAKIFDRMSIGR